MTGLKPTTTSHRNKKEIRVAGAKQMVLFQSQHKFQSSYSTFTLLEVRRNDSRIAWPLRRSVYYSTFLEYIYVWKLDFKKFSVHILSQEIQPVENQQLESVHFSHETRQNHIAVGCREEIFQHLLFF